MSISIQKKLKLKMRFIILIFLISLVVQSNAAILDDILNSVTKTIKQIIRPEEILKKISDTIVSIINIDKILEKLKQMFTFEEIWNKIKNVIKFQEIFNNVLKFIKQKPQQLLNSIIDPLKNLYNKRSSACDKVCESWYNYVCFLVLDCQKKKQEFQDFMIFPLVLIGGILVCCCGAYIFSTYSYCVGFIACIFYPLKVAFQTLQRYYRNSHSKLQTEEEKQNNEDLPPNENQSRIKTFKNWVCNSCDWIKQKIFKKENNTNQEHQDHEIEPQNLP